MVTPSPVYLIKTRITRYSDIRILEMIATSSFLTALECTKFDFGWGSAPDPAGGAYSTPPDSPAGLRSLLLRGKEGEGKREEK